MAGPAHTFDAWVLNRRPPAESFQTLTIFSTAHGTQTALQRVAKKPGTNAGLDLFDEASLVVEEPNASQAVFVKEARILTRHTEPTADHKILLHQFNLELPPQPPPRITAARQLAPASAHAL